ncbi:MAG: ABC transporter, partial [Eggerthella lenta]
ATAAVRAGERSVRLPKWGIEAATSAAVPEDVKALGVRAFFLQRVDGPGENCYRVRVDRVSDSRFERTVLLGFLDRDESEAPTVSRTDDEMKYLHQHLFWRVDKLAVPVDELPHEGEELWIRIPPDKVYLVSR